MKYYKNILQRPFFIKLLHWEYWPFDLVYIPVYIYWAWLSLRNGAFFFFKPSNPAIRNAGFLMESKKEIYNLLQKEHYPSTLLFTKDDKAQFITEKVKSHALKFPLIGKPDTGMKGLAVKKILNESQLLNYAGNAEVDFLIQEFIPYENEVGIFYYRYPGEERGYISGIVGKEFLSVTGDGQSTIEQLLLKDSRHILQLPFLKSTNRALLKKVLGEGEKELLVPYGNHARGAKFIDLSNQNNEKLETIINNICSKIEGFYFGRMDIRYNSWEELEAGQSFSIIELNGAGSEPTHIYDPHLVCLERDHQAPQYLIKDQPYQSSPKKYPPYDNQGRISNAESQRPACKTVE